ncbi:MAG TPA: tetratricopeptide repeat protein [Methylovorus sp.]|nr:tetratricopeptide repeat protein [Methylovorus sp.]
MVKRLLECLVCMTLLLPVAGMAASLEEAKAAVDAGKFAQAATIYRELAAAGDAKAQYNLGLMYARGDGVSENPQEAVKWYRLSAEQGFPEAQYALGVIYFSRDAGVTMDYDEAINWYRKAAEQGHVRSQLNLGIVYLRGDVVAQNIPEALKWFGLAAEQGDSDAQFNLGNMYLEGEGVPASAVNGYMWIWLAAENPHDAHGRSAKRKKLLLYLEAKMTPEQLNEARALAQACQAQHYQGCKLA